MLGREKMNGSEMRALWGSRIVIWITIILVLFPVVWIVMSSFSAGDSFFLSSLFPEKFSVEHYVTLFRETDFTVWVWNSLKFCVIVATIQLVITSLAAYAFARLRFIGRKYGLMSLLVLQVFPNSMAVAGYYILIYRFGLVDSSLALIFVLAGGSGRYRRGKSFRREKTDRKDGRHQGYAQGSEAQYVLHACIHLLMVYRL